MPLLLLQEDWRLEQMEGRTEQMTPLIRPLPGPGSMSYQVFFFPLQEPNRGEIFKPTFLLNQLSQLLSLLESGHIFGLPGGAHLKQFLRVESPENAGMCLTTHFLLSIYIRALGTFTLSSILVKYVHTKGWFDV